MRLIDRVKATAQGQQRTERGAVRAMTSTPVTDLKSFYDLVLPAGGRYVLFQDKRHTFHSTMDDLIAETTRRIDTQGLYYATASYGEADNRKAENVRRLKAFRVDIDAGVEKFAKHPQDAYPTQREAVAALDAFVAATGLEPTLVVSSGEGLHVYWCLDATVTPEEWKPVALALNAAGKAHGLKIDAGCTADTARVLRPIGSPHKNGSRVTVLRGAGQVWALSSFASSVTALVPADARVSRVGQSDSGEAAAINADILGAEQADRRDRDAGLIVASCPMLAAFKAGEMLAEPLWRAQAGVLQFCREGEKLWHQWSALDARYDAAEAQQKWDGYAAGPTRCGQAPQCDGCKHRGTISSPVQLGDAAPETVASQAGDAPQGLAAAVAAGGLLPILDTSGRLHFVTVAELNGRKVRTVMPADSEAASDAIIALASTGGRPPTDRAIELFKAQLRHRARQRGEATPVAIRAAQDGDRLFVDLGPGRVAAISPAGVTVLDDVADGVPLFRRGSGAGHLPDPEPFPSTRDALRFAVDVFKGFGLATDQALVMLGTLLEWHRSATAHPILEIVGPAGCGKSTLSDFVVSLIDPSDGNGRVTVGTALPDIGAAAQHRYVLPLDNAGRLDRATSDTLCIVSTGGTLLVRLLYTNGETAQLHLHRPLIVTAVSPVCTAPDLQSRVVRIELPARGAGYAAEGELRGEWNALRPKMLGALYTLLSGALQELPRVRPGGQWKHRLVDLDQLGEAVIAAAGAAPGAFLAAMGRLRESMARRTASGDLFMIELLKVLRTLGAKPTHTEAPSLRSVMRSEPALAVYWPSTGRAEVTIRPGALHRLLPRPPTMHGGGVAPGVPLTERGATDAVRRVQPLLAGIGVEVKELPFGTKTLLWFGFDLEAISDDSA